MDRLRQWDLRGLVDFLMDGYGVGDLDAFARHIVRALPRLVPCSTVAYNEINARLSRINWLADPDEATRFPDCEAILSEHIGDHPVVQRTARTGTAEWARLSDFVTRRQLADMPIYHEFYRRVNVHYQLGIMYPSENGVSMAIVLNRDVKDFSDRERVLLNLLRHHLRRAYENAEALTLARNQVTLLRRGVDSAGLGLLALRADGRIAFASERARRWLRIYFGWDEASPEPPAALARWMQEHKVDYSTPGEIPAPARPLVVERDDRALSVRLMRDNGHDLLVMKEITRGFPIGRLEARGLTHREAEVLGWVVEGKTNPEIGLILGLSPRTVHHHLDRIYEKLGVETRTAAARVARELADAES